jgi:hypothetical protein
VLVIGFEAGACSVHFSEMLEKDTALHQGVKAEKHSNKDQTDCETP